MANLSMQSNLKSPLVLTYTEPKRVEVLSYKNHKSTGVLVPSWNTITKTMPAANTDISGQTFNIELTRMGKLQQAWVRVPFRFSSTGAALSAVGDALMGPIGLRMADIEVWNFSGKLYTQDADKLQGQVNMLPLNQKLAIMQRAMVLNNTTEEFLGTAAIKETSYCTYIPILLPSYFNTRNNWDLEVLEPLIVKIKFNNIKHLGLIATVHTLQSIGEDLQLITQTVDYEPEYKQQLYLSNFGTEGANVPYLSYDSETQLTVCSGATSTKVKLATVVPCFLTHCFIRLLVNITNTKPKNHNIQKIDVFLNNQSYIQNVPVRALVGKADFFSSCNVIMDNDGKISVDTKPISTISWSDRPQDRTSFSGCLAYGGINLPEFTFTYATLTPADNEIVIVSEFYSELLMNGSSGRIYKSVSS